METIDTQTTEAEPMETAEPRPRLIGTARKVTMPQARRAFASGATVLVHEDDRGPEVTVSTWSTTHNRKEGTWDELHNQVKMWRSGYPRQTFYVVQPSG